MAYNNEKRIEELVAEICNRLAWIESFPDKLRSYSNLYDSAIKALPLLSNRREKKGILTRTIEGTLGDNHMIDYTSRFGIITICVTDIRQFADNSVQKEYYMKFHRKKAYYDILIREIHNKTGMDQIVQKNRFDKEVTRKG